MATIRRQHGGKVLDMQVMHLYNEGWHIPNIASIARVKPDEVRAILERNKINLDTIQM